MRCYARPLAFLALVIGAAMAVCGMFSLLLDAIGFVTGTLVLTVVAVRLAIARTTRRQAAAGACTACRHQCQRYLDGSRPEIVLVVDEPDIRQATWPEAGSWVQNRLGLQARDIRAGRDDGYRGTGL